MSGTIALAVNALNDFASSILENSFPNVATITRPTFTIDAYGGSTPSYSTVASNVPCSWKSTGNDAKEYVRALKITGVATYAIELPNEVDVKSQDRIIIGAQGSESAHTFEVKGIVRKSGVSLYVICTLDE